jgi:8-oxo-dGTP pyrophosphatase MutT (NUDIX family)
MTNSHVPDTLGRMEREISAGGVVVRQGPKGWLVALIEPHREASAAASAKRRSQKLPVALPKGLVDPGEKPEETALREVLEETGLTAVPIAKLADIKYVYTRTWGDRKRVFKIVSFYLLKYQSGEIGDISPEMKIEVKRARWVPLAEAVGQLSYSGEKDVMRKAMEYLEANPELAPDHKRL